MQFNEKLSCLALGLAMIGDQAVAEKTAWDLVVKSSETAYWQASKEAVSAELEYVKASKALKRQGQALPSQAVLREQLEALGFRFEGDRVVTPAEGYLPVKTVRPAPVFRWKRVALGQTAGQPYVELRRQGTGEIRTLMHGDSIDGWTVSIRNALVTVVKNGIRKTL
ncbi:hypothetical protein [Marinobacterium arenosum]|uniref:hypothetical protein n=1 Tax=Marinobacterium arenosum TaxID=2862496 RepID=UPI001C9726CA|nr:hypothetical protein [Marinobacterium arenosum]MBY4677951.1 hypothetical protein [Marinobacterium arenosum]